MNHYIEELNKAKENFTKVEKRRLDLNNDLIKFLETGYTKTNNTDFIWITSDYEHAKQYSEINKLSYGGDFIIDEITILIIRINIFGYYVIF